MFILISLDSILITRFLKIFLHFLFCLYDCADLYWNLLMTKGIVEYILLSSIIKHQLG